MEPDELAPVLARGGPAIDDVRARLARNRVAAALFGVAEPVRIGRYELERQLGAGGGGVVFLARDPELSRRVALKLLATLGSRERMLAEGHALARLSHPNVVPIFDVGTYENQIYLVMELVEGGTLRTWVEEAPRTLRAVVRAYREAGAGVAAAHRAGFVHRDFKPDNALIGTDQRVRVVDFGLVHVEGEARAGLGTPRYMPPEQAAGGEVTPAADQYAFCASLREAAAARKTPRGERAGSVPRWLDDVLARGLARRPEDRWPSMEALLDALAHDPATRWRRRGAVAGVLALGAATFAVGRAQSDEPPPCDGGKAELAAVWSPATRTQLASRLAALATPYAQQVSPQLVGAFDHYASAWSTQHLGACQAHRRGAQSDALFDRRMSCLATARAALDAAVATVRDASAAELAGAVVAVGELPQLARCADTALVTANVAPPSPPQAAEAAAIERALAAREVEVRAARRGAVPAIDALVERARALGYKPVLAKALRLRGVAAITMDEREAAVAPLAEATTLAFAAGDDELAIEAFGRRAWSEGTMKDTDHQRTLAGLELIEAIAARLPPGARATRALLANNIGGVELSRGDRDRARAAFERAVAEQPDVIGSSAAELAQIPANYALVVDDPAHRDALFAQTIAKLTALVGATHPLTLDAKIIAAFRTDDAARAAAGLERACSDLLALHPERKVSINECAGELAWFAEMRGDRTAARRWFAVVVASDAPGDDDDDDIAIAAGHILRLDGTPRDAIRRFEERRAALGTIDEPWWRRLPRIELELGLALALRDANDPVGARAAFTRARDLLLSIRDHPNAGRQRRLAFVERALTASP